ncbi:hypothetical protein AVKW3434_22905 [Acidovorax sp. SUPP3434]|uniref:hypothetical protein n=1 Tax=Acidovorax sp. SUPP3434 TaxID=2920880 RepID=UPI0023DE56BA|nr:hypothetical protein [Acidovorax sp. SUPP3434]GKT02292.1 hypothetical protein AVKW3434_22905 [Acidovorax sp. SUPP3434]
MPALQMDFEEFAAFDAANDCCPPVCAGASAALVAQVGGEGGIQSVAGNEKRKGRPAKHVDAAARKAAYRAEKARIDYTDRPEIIAKLRETAATLDCSVNELLQSMVRFAECNRNWKQVGLYGARKNGVLQ